MANQISYKVGVEGEVLGGGSGSKVEVCIDTSDFPSMVKLMDKYKDLDSMLSGTNNDGERVLISISEDVIVVVTFQNNGWMRKNVYWRDGTIEELFDGRWKEAGA